MKSPIMGSDGSFYTRSGNSIFSLDGVYQKVGRNIYGSNGKFMIQTDGAPFINGPGASGYIMKMGSNYNTPKGIYILQGNILYSPMGKTWMNVTPDDVETIILSDM